MGLTEAQRAMRRTGITASEISTLADLNPYRTPMEIFLEKVHPKETKQSLRMELGDVGEDAIAKLYERRTGFHLLPSDTLRHPEKTVAIATPDRLCFLEPPPKGARPKDADHLLQIKWSGWRQRGEWGPEGTDEVPAMYLAQTQWEMFVAEVPRACVGVLFDRDEFLTYHLELDRELVEGLLEIGERFFTDHVLAMKPPPPDASEKYAELIAHLHPRQRPGVFKPCTPEIEEVARQLRAFESTKKDLEAAILERCNQLREFIGDAEGVVTPLGRITWKANRPSVCTDWEGLARQMAVLFQKARAAGADLPRLADLVRAHTTEKPGARVLRKSWSE